MSGKDMGIILWLQEMVKNVNELLEATIADVTPEQAHWHNGVVGNGFTHCGEISCLKGLQGKRGYPI